MNKYFIDVIKNHYFDFSGKATRTQFWLFVLINFIVSFVLMLVCGIFLNEQTAKIISIVYGLALLLPGLGIAARRLRDGGFSPWLLLLGLIPFIGPIILLILYIMPSK
ncbi:MAG: DUF805 domain-containing protein [Elusimicrobiaceae bacterium]|nr:DUF805 domain-containing protein [Elusimicrobiaceae bacterium]